MEKDSIQRTADFLQLHQYTNVSYASVQEYLR